MTAPVPRERPVPVFLSPAELVQRWQGRVTEKTPANWRQEHRGPAWTKLGGRVAYQIEDVIAWEAQPGFNEWLQRRQRRNISG